MPRPAGPPPSPARRRRVPLETTRAKGRRRTALCPLSRWCAGGLGPFGRSATGGSGWHGLVSVVPTPWRRFSSCLGWLCCRLSAILELSPSLVGQPFSFLQGAQSALSSASRGVYRRTPTPHAGGMHGHHALALLTHKSSLAVTLPASSAVGTRRASSFFGRLHGWAGGLLPFRRLCSPSMRVPVSRLCSPSMRVQSVASARRACAGTAARRASAVAGTLDSLLS
jgi:hypothetical protein